MKSDSNFKDFGERRGSRVECFGVPPGLDSITNKVWDLSVWSLVSTDECLYNLLVSRDTSQVSRLDLTNADKITDKGMQVVAHNMAALEDLSLENAYRITDTGLKEVVTHCLRLRLLNLSGCLGIPGLSFALLGQHACNIVQLNVSGCSQIPSWAFMKVFQGCINLEDLDLSYCSQITDRDIKVLGECCPGLKQLLLKECVQISDIGIVSLKTSQTLESIDLSRKSLSSRITDVSLLALAEGCNDLCFISVSGCELITDVGISWLGNGCKKLVQLNISNCFKVSNAGLRYLGEECHELRTIILKNVKKISDVGIRFLACGCNKLEYLNASGLYLLTDGAHRAFGLEGIQSLGASLASRSIRRLNLRGCFHISTFSLNAMASMANLEFLDLSGCTLLTFEGMDKIANACKHLSHLSLASCGDCITNDMLYRISPKLLSLKSLDLSYCRMVGRIALKGLSHCTSLTSLNLTGCISITNEGILSLGEGRYKEGLQELNLSKCSKIDDTAIAWIADSFQAMEEEAGTVSLTTLVLTGTK
jgi:F-box and leucine-rich repeat protein 2/20